MSELNVLGGPVSAQFTYTTENGHAAALEACRLEQEAMCGYALVPSSTKQTSYDVVDPATGKSQHVWEVFVTFSPAPPPAPADATQLPPAI